MNSFLAGNEDAFVAGVIPLHGVEVVSEVEALMNEESLPVLGGIYFGAVAEEVDSFAFSFDIAGSMKRKDC